MSHGPIVVTGATGSLGRLAIARLLTRVPPERVAAVVRDPGRAADLGVEPRHGDYDEPTSLRSALVGAAGLLFISAPELDPVRRIRQHRAVVETARQVQVGRIVYTSFLEIAGLFEAHRATEEAIVASGLPYTLLRNPFYTEAFVPNNTEVADLVHATGGRGLNTATRPDLAEAAVAALLDPVHTGRRYELTGPLWTFPELARVLGVAARDGTVTGAMGWLHTLARAGALETQTGDLARLLGRPPVGIAAAAGAPADRR